MSHETRIAFGAEYNEHLDDTATVASMVGCWVNPFFICMTS
jgi:hypothetical protein